MTPQTQSTCSGGETQLKYAHLDGGIFDQGIRLSFDGRACLDCGFVMLMLRPQSLDEARKQPGFKPWGT